MELGKIDTEFRVFGLLKKRSIWLPSGRGLMFVLLFFLPVGGLTLSRIYPFLAANQPVDARYLAVEGWIPDYAMEKALAEFKQGRYERLFVTGGPVAVGGPLSDYKTFAEVGARVLVSLGAKPEEVVAVPAGRVRKDRTYASALALHDWFKKSNIQPGAVNVVSVGVHCRRTQMLFREAFGKGISIGIISVEDDEYDPSRWWKYSAGFRNVSSELIAVIYAALFFHP